MSSWLNNPAYSENPDKEAMYAARRAMRDQAMLELVEAEAKGESEFENVTTSPLFKLKVRVSQLRHACAKYLVSYCWMKNRIGGSHMYDVYPETREEADAAIEVYRRRKIQYDADYPLVTGEGGSGRFVAYENKPEWWDRVCC